jgi:hypothetical protein
MEGECYALIWGVMHFRQYLHWNYFMFLVDHKPLEWLVIMLDINNKMGKWIDTLHDFNFKIIHKIRSKHTNVDALNRNMVDVVEEEDETWDEIQDYKVLHVN